ncbi:Scr1 family TA system antitoxin-like transcriptional regulator [Streptomyces sp. Edi4]|uniref:helix-turn-helix domain-containing protein n=1 Tax=Streptomyces sp. Edi4 TaxID=3162527 RepID=UPI0033062C2E
MPNTRPEPELSPAWFLGQEVLRLRRALGWPQAKLAEKAHMAVSRIGQIENATIPATLDNARDLDAALGTDGILERLMVLVDNRPAVPDWLALYIDLESRAVSYSEYAPMHVPGLLQTPDYARTVLTAGLIRKPSPTGGVDAQLATRLQRQEIIQRAASPALWFILEESLLRRPVGGPLLMAEQLGHLAAMADHPAVHIQVLPETIGAHPALGGSLILLALPDRANVAYLEGSSIGQLFEEPTKVARFGLVYDYLQALALTPSESVAMIRLAQEDMTKMSRTQPHDVTGADFRKSTHSNNEGACVEVATNLPGIIPVRDSKHGSRGGPTLTTTPAAWATFVAGFKG